MTEKKTYICDICLTEYVDKEKAEKCEKDHSVITVIKDLIYHPHARYPHEIEVEFSDGSTIWYGKN